MEKKTKSDWTKAEQNRGLGYNGLSDRTKRRHEKDARDQEIKDAATRKGASSDSSGESRPGSPTSTAEQASPTSTEAPSGSRKRRQAVFRVRAPPPRKRRKLVVSARDARREQQEKRLKELKKAFKDIRRLIRSKKDVFHAGSASLQAYRARAIESHLTMVLKNGRKHMEASEMAAEAHGFARNWGGRLVRHWVRTWIDKRELPVSERGCHAKTFSLLSDPNVRENVRSFLRSNKWSSDPQMLSTFMRNEMLPDLAKRYAVDEIAPQMARGLKQYLEVELFPRIQFKVARGISMTAQANDGRKRSWVLDGEHAIKKKGVGRGMHQSDVICSTVGWLKDASESLEYGKNYEGYWDGERFCRQLREKIIPVFERMHGAGHRAVFLIDNSQGHSAYSVDALLATRMNLKPGGKQARMRDGWFMRDGKKVIQSMIFPASHAEHPNQPKGIKAYLRENCDYTFDTLKANLPLAMEAVSLDTIRRWEHRMVRWIDAYRGGLDAKEAQRKVKEFSSKRYKSHRRPPERLARLLDA
ncbi:hypothetical protein K523DRAFT_370933, partial [Schizophyllum commune Tattone D]